MKQNNVTVDLQKFTVFRGNKRSRFTQGRDRQLTGVARHRMKACPLHSPTPSVRYVLLRRLKAHEGLPGMDSIPCLQLVCYYCDIYSKTRLSRTRLSRIFAQLGQYFENG